MNWKPLHSIEDVEKISIESSQKAQLIFKHSTRCSISSTALHKFESSKPNNDEMDCYLLDLLNHRDVSNYIAETYKVHHESPQVLVIRDGECIFDESHLAIEWDEIVSATTTA